LRDAGVRYIWKRGKNNVPWAMGVVKKKNSKWKDVRNRIFQRAVASARLEKRRDGGWLRAKAGKDRNPRKRWQQKIQGKNLHG